MAGLEWHDFGLKKAPKNSIVYPTLKIKILKIFKNEEYLLMELLEPTKTRQP